MTQTNDGYTIVIDWIVADYGVEAALVHGVIYRYCQMRKGICFASLTTMGAKVGMTRQRFARHLQTLLQAGLVEDLTPDAVGVPHEYTVVFGRTAPEKPSSGDETCNAVSETCNKIDQPCYETEPLPVAKRNTRTTSRNTKGIQEEEGARDARASPGSGQSLAPDRKTPAIHALYLIRKRYPPKPLWPKLADIIGDSPDGAKLHRCYMAWVERGYNGNAWTWATEWYSHGIPNGKKKAPEPHAVELSADVAAASEAVLRQYMENQNAE